MEVGEAIQEIIEKYSKRANLNNDNFHLEDYTVYVEFAKDIKALTKENEELKISKVSQSNKQIIEIEKLKAREKELENLLGAWIKFIEEDGMQRRSLGAYQLYTRGKELLTPKQIEQ